MPPSVIVFGGVFLLFFPFLFFFLFPSRSFASIGTGGEGSHRWPGCNGLGLSETRERRERKKMKALGRKEGGQRSAKSSHQGRYKDGRLSIV